MIELSAEVRAELESGRPVVALETTLVAHGFPAGEGLAVALEAERRVREAGAVPASVGVVGGAVRVGLSAEELGRFAEAGEYARKHVPWSDFRNVPGAVNKPFTSFPATGFARLPTVSFVIPNL